MRRLIALGAAAALVLLAIPALAVTNGEPDTSEEFPAVGQLLFFDPAAIDPRFTDPGAWFNCTGTLLSDTVVLTAGHCTFGIGEDGGANADGREGTDVWVNFEFAPDYSILPPSAGFAPDNNAARYLRWERALDRARDWRRGTAHPHPGYVDAAFFLFDVGVVVLNKPVPGRVHEGNFGSLPPAGHLDQYLTQRGSQQRFTPVGYGIQEVVPDFMSVDQRYFASVMLVDGQGTFGIPAGTSVVFSNNGGNHATGGTCFGDSGGPIFDGDSRVIVAVTSFGINNNCVGTGGGYRIDQLDDLEWLYTRWGLGADPTP